LFLRVSISPPSDFCRGPFEISWFFPLPPTVTLAKTLCRRYFLIFLTPHPQTLLFYSKERPFPSSFSPPPRVSPFFPPSFFLKRRSPLYLRLTLSRGPAVEVPNAPLELPFLRLCYHLFSFPPFCLPPKSRAALSLPVFPARTSPLPIAPAALTVPGSRPLNDFPSPLLSSPDDFYPVNELASHDFRTL